ncbi:MAG: DUF3822 family protein [Chitinophagaceae bacterium]|jgi:hypothetical protein|nr:DUF3822 family protein [Chitinophagaceae bacterium]
MVSKSIDIGSNALLPYEPHSRRLLLEWAPSHLHVLLWNKGTQSIEGLESYQGEIADEEAWEWVLAQSRLLPLSDVEALLLSAGPRVLPIPGSLFQADRVAAEMNLLLGAAEWQHLGADLVPAHDMVIAWQMPSALLDMLQQHFGTLTHRHLLSQLLQQPSPTGLSGQLIVAERSVLCLLQHQHAVLFAGSLPVMEEDDLSYRLLNICRQHQVDPQEVPWQLSGTIEQDSPLYKGIALFLRQLSWLPESWSLPGQVSARYFAHLTQALV